jgi:rfaE bifunctional protein nucleotidyltransferase chain/domain/rfaE bifunctional protein kinase chain/domain
MTPVRDEHVVVLGDALLDVDLVGRAGRLCPDAPVPVLDDVVEHDRPGGAALAAHLLARDGHRVTLVAALGDDTGSARLRAALHPSVRVVALRHDGPTPVKTRVRSAGQSLLRIDTGTSGPIGDLRPEAAEALREASCVLVADYGHGIAAHAAVRAALSALPRSVPVVWDPHQRGAVPVPGLRLVTPNLDEALKALSPGDGPERPSSELGRAGRAAASLAHAWGAGAVAVTLGHRGALVSHGSGTPVVVPAPLVDCVDPCGAGDRFAATVTASLGQGALVTEAVQQAVGAASAYVAAGGASGLHVTAADGTPVGALDPSLPADVLAAGMRASGGTVVATGGCFDLLHAGHVESLRAARSMGDWLVVCLNSDRSVREIKGAGRPIVPEADRTAVLLALECVDAVLVFDEETPAAALRRLRPHVWAKGGDYSGVDLPESAVLAEWGGDAVVLPYLQGRSTTGLVSSATALDAAR